jgi:hypothetical protein
VTGQDGSRRRKDFPPEAGGSAAGDILEQGGRRLPILQWRPQWPTFVAVAAALVIGIALGYGAGKWHSADMAGSLRSNASASSAGPPAAAVPALDQSGECSAQVGRALQLGVQVINQSAAAVTLRRVTAVLPLGGLKPISQTWGPCGELPGAASANSLPAGASTWITVTFRVLISCPRPVPVQFTVDYDWHGQPAIARLPGFPDLGQVNYTGCLAG